MSPLPLVYVHGAGPQAAASVLKHELDVLLFGKDMPTTRVARYADVRWPPAAGGGLGVAAGGASRQRRATAIRAATDPTTSARAAAARVVAAAIGTPTSGVGAAPPPSPDTVAEARKLVAGLYGRADRIAAVSSVPRSGLALAPTIPDSIFRFIVGKFATDVVDYLYGPFAEAMRAPVRAALLQAPTPRVVVAHSLGTIITYDVLSEPALAGLDVDLLVTLGSPLAYGNVQARLRDRKGRPHPVPPFVHAWTNYADRFDPVALDQTLRNDFDPGTNIHDHEVNNPARNNHDLNGYASIAMIRAEISAAAG